MTEKAVAYKQKPPCSVILQANKMSKFMDLTQTAGKKREKNKRCERLKTEYKMPEQIRHENRENSA